MLPGIELWPDQADDRPIAQADLDALVEATAGVGDVLLKVRWFTPAHLAQLAEAVPSAWFLTRPTAEGYTAVEIAAGIKRAAFGLEQAGLRSRWLAHEVANEPNHPDGPFGDTGAGAFAGALAEASGLVDVRGVPLASPGLTPYYGTAAWAAELNRFDWGYRGAHCYAEQVPSDPDDEASLARAIGDVGVQAGVGEPLIVTELGDASRKPLADRIAWTARALARAGELGAIAGVLFVLRAPGWEHYQLGPAAFNQIMRSTTKKPGRSREHYQLGPAAFNQIMRSTIKKPGRSTMVPNVLRWREQIVAAAGRAGVAPALVAAVMAAESGGNQYRDDGSLVTSPAGAIGLMQLMPATATALGVDVADPWQNILGGAHYLAQMYGEFGDWLLAVAAYNAGPGAVHHAGGVPDFDETQRYVRSVRAYLLDYLELDVEQIIADDDALQHAPRTRMYREAYGNALGVADMLAERIAAFRAGNADVAGD